MGRRAACLVMCSALDVLMPVDPPAVPDSGWTRVVQASDAAAGLGWSGYVAHLRWLWAHVPLILSLARTQLKLTVSRSRLYYLWWMFDPVLDTACYAVLFALLRANDNASLGLQSNGEAVPTVAFLLAGIVPWRFNQACWTAAAQTWQTHRAILEQVRFPHLVLLLARFLSEAWLYAVSLAVLVGAAVLFGVTPTWTWLLLPAWVAVHGLVVLAFMPLFAIASAFSLDLLKLQPYALRLLFFFSPILYALDPLVPPWARPWMLLNPITLLMETYRGLLLYGTTPPLLHLFAYIAALLSVLLATSYTFVRLQSAMSRSVTRMY